MNSTAKKEQNHMPSLTILHQSGSVKTSYPKSENSQKMSSTAIIAVTGNLKIEEVQRMNHTQISERLTSLLKVINEAPVDLSIYLAQERLNSSNGAGWLLWAKDLTGYQERELYHYLNVGKMFLEKDQYFYDKFKDAGVTKLLAISSCKKIDKFFEKFGEVVKLMTVAEVESAIAQLKGKAPQETKAPKTKEEKAFANEIKNFASFAKIESEKIHSIAHELDGLVVLESAGVVIDILSKSLDLNKIPALDKSLSIKIAEQLFDIAMKLKR